MEHPLYVEEQKFRQPAAWILTLAFTALGWYGFIQQIIIGEPFGSNPAPDWMIIAVFILMGLVFPWLFLTMGIKTSVFRDRVDIGFYPFYKKSIPLDKIESFKIRRFRPIRDFGGWGIRYDFDKTTALIVSGKIGIELKLHDGKIYLVGSGDIQKFDAVLRSLIKKQSDIVE